MVQALRSGKCQGGRKARGGVVGQPGLDNQLLEGYKQATSIIAPNERDEEKRNVHRVREYWLELEASQHLPQLLELKIPVASFEEMYTKANEHNPKYSKTCLRESMRSFFREHLDENGVKYLTLKMSERPVCTKPSKNILKRWNLSNGMLYFFYSAVGRSEPPTGDEILEPFYYQKRIDFIRKVCLPGATADSPTHDARKRRRPEGSSLVLLPPSDLRTPATGRQDAASLYEHLAACFDGQVEEGQVEDAVESGVWVLEQEQPYAAGAGALEGDRRGIGRAFWVPSLEKVEEWSFENGALRVFVRACGSHWRRRVEQAWRAWNDELGNNSLDWGDLWRGMSVEDVAQGANTAENAPPTRRHAPPRASARKSWVGEGRAVVKLEEPSDANVPPTTPDAEGIADLEDTDLFSVDVEGEGRLPEDDCLIFDDAGGWIGPGGVPVVGKPVSMEESLVMSDSDASLPNVVMACEDNDPYPPMDMA